MGHNVVHLPQEEWKDEEGSSLIDFCSFSSGRPSGPDPVVAGSVRRPSVNERDHTQASGGAVGSGAVGADSTQHSMCCVVRVKPRHVVHEVKPHSMWYNL